MTTKETASDQHKKAARPKPDDFHARAKRKVTPPCRSRMTPDAVERWERAHQAVQLRRSGLMWDEIAERCGYSNRGSAYNAAKKFMHDYPREDAEALRDMETDRIDQVQTALWPRVLSGDPRAVEVWTKLSERRSKLMGMDKPERKEVTVLTEDAVDHAIRQAREEMEAKARAAGVEVPQVTV